MELLTKAMTAFEQNRQSEQSDLASAYFMVGFAYANLSDFYSSLDHLEKALKIFEKIHPENHPEIITTKQNIAAVKTAITNRNSNDEL